MNPMKQLKLYIAGPMRGIDLFNFPAFFQCAAVLRGLGHIVTNPAEVDMAMGINPHFPIDHPDQIEFDIEEVLRKDIQLVMRQDGIVMLDGSLDSTGANIERAVAMMTGVPVYYYNGSARHEDILQLVEPCELVIGFTSERAEA